MNVIKKRVRACFNRAAATYDQHCSVQLEVAQHLLKLVPAEHQYERVLDLGCGTGSCTQLLLQNRKIEDITLLDIADKLLRLAQQQLDFPNTHYVQADFDTMGDDLQGPYDLIFSNMAMHWSIDLLALMQKLAGALKQKGIFVFSLPVEGTFIRLEEEIHNHFPTVSYLEEVVQKAGFTINDCVIVEVNRKFDNLRDALDSVRKIGANYLLSEKHRKISRQEVLLLKKAEPVKLTYRIACFCNSYQF